MYLASIPAPPLSSWAPAGLAAGLVAVDEPLAAASTSSFTIRPPGPLPATASSATPWAAAARRATGEALASPFSAGARVAAAGGAEADPFAADGELASVAAPAPALMRAST